MPEDIINTTSAATPLGTYPHARRVGNLLFLSGIGSRNATDNKIPGLELSDDGSILKYDIEAECHQVFANVKAGGRKPKPTKPSKTYPIKTKRTVMINGKPRTIFEGKRGGEYVKKGDGFVKVAEAIRATKSKK